MATDGEKFKTAPVAGLLLFWWLRQRNGDGDNGDGDDGDGDNGDGDNGDTDPDEPQVNTSQEGWLMTFEAVEEHHSYWWTINDVEKTGQTVDYGFRSEGAGTYNGELVWQTHDLKKGELSFTFDVREFDIQLVSTRSPDTAVVGETITVEATFSNEGDVPGPFRRSLFVETESGERERLDERDAYFDPGDTHTFSWSFSFNSAGTYSLAVGSEQFADITITDEPQVEELSYTNGDRRGGQTLEISLYQTIKLTENNDRAPERASALYTHEMLKRHDMNHVIRYGFPAQDSPGEFSNCNQNELAGEPIAACEGCGCDHGTEFDHTHLQPEYEDEPIDWWREELGSSNVPWVAKDSNVLLTNDTGGGCGAIRGNYCVAGMQEVGAVRSHTWDSQLSYYYRIWTVMHEIGHNTGFEHDDSGGDTWWGEDDSGSEDGYLHVTPCHGRIEHDGWCGQYQIPWDPSSDPPRWYHLYWSDCHVDNMHIV